MTLWEEPAPPRAELISAVVVDDWTVRVEGTDGAVPGRSRLLVADVGTRRGAITQAAGDGSFQAAIVSGPGGVIQVALLANDLPEVGPGFTLGDSVHQILHARPSTYVRVPASTPDDLPPGAQAVTVMAHAHVPEGPVWHFTGYVQDLDDEVRVTGEARFRSITGLSPEYDDPFAIVGRLSRIFGAQGEPLPEMGAYATAYTTPSGLPLERSTRQEDPTLGWADCVPARVSSTTLSCEFDLRLPASGIPAGGYAVRIDPGLPPPSSPGQEAWPPEDLLIRGGRTYDFVDGVPLTVIQRGVSEPFRLAALLLVDAPAQAARGVQANGDAEVWGWSNRIAWQPAMHVTPREDATGNPIHYILEPHLPQVFLADRDLPQSPLVDLDLPGGSWTVTIRDPEGRVTTLGPAPFRQAVTRTATTVDGDLLNSGGGNVNAVARLATLDEAFRHAFAVDGLHVLMVEGEVEDMHGNLYRIQGTYDVLVAEPLDLDLGTLPGTPLLVGEPINRAIQVHPPVPAKITYRLRAWTGPDAELTHDSTTEGHASLFGWFHDHAHHPSTRINEPGEYRVDVFANYTDPSGKQYAAAWTFGGVIVDATDALAVHGRRGIDMEAQDLARFLRRDTGIEAGGNHFNFPYYPGDVAWQTDDDSMEVRVTIDDPGRLIAPLLEGRGDSIVAGIDASREDIPWMPLGDHVRERFLEGQGPLFSTTATGRDSALGDPLDVPQGIFATGGYAALWVLTGDDDPQGSRVDSPFNPEASPILRVHGREVRAFFEPTGIRPGSLLVEGDAADFGGYVVPLGPHQVDYRITSPSGQVRELSTHANPWGHLHDTRLNFTVEEAGIWHVSVAVTACPLAHDADKGWPCLTGGLNDGETSYVFYVASRDAAPIPMDAPGFSGRTLCSNSLRVARILAGTRRLGCPAGRWKLARLGPRRPSSATTLGRCARASPTSPTTASAAAYPLRR